MASEPLPATIGIVGAGRMGRGIATAFALAGYPVRLIDLRDRSETDSVALAATIRREIDADIALLERRGLVSADARAEILARVAFVAAADKADALGASDVVFEAVPETLDAKRDAFATIDAHVQPGAIVASTTSTIDAETLAPMLRDAGRFLNAHWLNPAHLIPLVELSPSAATSPDTLSRLRAILEAIGKVPVTCRPSPGYIVPRIQALAMNEAARLVEEGVASVEDIDTAVRVGFGLRFAILGLLEFTDWGGGDILHHASAYLSDTLDHRRFAAPESIGRNMAEGRKGLADGRGFYDYTGQDLAAYREERLSELLALLRLRGLMPHIADTPGKRPSLPSA
jgi:3-hydroxybutyryl-CoA dehydrogenase